MPLPHRDTVVLAATIALVAWGNVVVGKPKKSPLCPIGFDLAYSKHKEPYCLRLKGPEAFEDSFEDCAGNLYTSQLYYSLNLTRSNVDLWSGHKSLYPGGPFIDWSFTDTTGSVLTSTYDVKFNPALGLDEELCVIISPVSNFTAARCNERHYRYCIVHPYPDAGDMTSDGCGELTDYYRFWSPKPTCLTPVTGIGGGGVRANWRQGQDLCLKRGGALLQRGWRYANNPLLHVVDTNWTSPLGIEMISGDNLRWVNDEDGSNLVPESEWNFKDEDFSLNTSLVALRDGTWHLVNGSYVFRDVICERSIHLNNVSLNVTVVENKIVLSVNDSVDESDIYCFTDSIVYYPSVIKKMRQDDNTYILKTIADGHYWCIHIDSRNFRVSESNKALLVREDNVENLYAIKIRLKRKYRFENLDKIYRVWEKKLKEYIYYRTKYVERFGEVPVDEPNMAEETLQKFKDSTEGSGWKDNEVIYLIKIKRLFLDGKTALLHVQMNPKMRAVPPGFWEDLEIIYMKPAYFCNRNDDLVPFSRRVPLGHSVVTAGCRNYTCVGDFNQGVQFVTTSAADCELLPSTAVTTSVRVSPDVYLPMPTLIPDIVPKEQLQQVMHDLDHLVNNDSVPIMVENVSAAVDQVDELFDLEDDLEIPGELLHLIDQLAARADLNGSGTAQAVANNIAMLMADASPQSPVRGLRIAAQGNDDVFSGDAFEIISEEVNSTHLTTDESEAVVHLPDSVTNSSRRISFVVFRNDRAFTSSHGLYSVNSRVLSIKIEDVTEFANGEVIDIHLRPLSGAPERNQTRTCAFWHFLDDDSGYWSTEGCTFIRAASPGLLDTCRCDHLTHFAEILVPRTVFSERNENVLEIISIVGCCLSILGLLLVGLTALMFRSWRRDFSNKIWLQLCIAIFILVICFLVIVFARFDHYDVGCMLVGVLLHYSVLASFCWMLVAAVLSYRRLVLVFTRDASHKLLRASAFSWGAPCAVVGILLSVNPHSYSGQFEEKAPTGSFCYPSGLSLWLTVYAPIAVMLLANWTLFVLIVRSVFASRRIQRHGDSNEALRCASVSCLLVFLFGLPWIFGLFAYNIVAAYFFALLATFQGFVLFVFFVLGNKKTRDLWLNKLKIKQTRKIPVTSSTYTNNKSQNSASDWRGGRVGPATIEANASKPRSLASPDESRFS
ncbi:uncharacterized protein isoform X2 [Choristoneura fumiferana]|uniref:uncharacterized protein isoform X2 n=1 Tax=Choristoneura fumiferana TaxID=7141 RepID=UPI003D15D994